MWVWPNGSLMATVLFFYSLILGFGQKFPKVVKFPREDVQQPATLEDGVIKESFLKFGINNPFG